MILPTYCTYVLLRAGSNGTRKKSGQVDTTQQGCYRPAYVMVAQLANGRGASRKRHFGEGIAPLEVLRLSGAIADE
jgi:hypothetical protein